MRGKILKFYDHFCFVCLRWSRKWVWYILSFFTIYTDFVELNIRWTTFSPSIRVVFFRTNSMSVSFYASKVVAHFGAKLLRGVSFSSSRFLNFREIFLCFLLTLNNIVHLCCDVTCRYTLGHHLRLADSADSVFCRVSYVRRHAYVFRLG